jgi:hypothetical protein
LWGLHVHFSHWEGPTHHLTCSSQHQIPSNKIGNPTYSDLVSTKSQKIAYIQGVSRLCHNCRRWFPRSLWWKNFI